MLCPHTLRITSTWDFDNRLVSATTGSTTVSHQYDALGRRVAHTVGSTTTVFVQAGQQTIADYALGAAAASSTYRYLYASYIDEPVMRWTTSSSTALYYHRNQKYSVTTLTDSSGSVIERYAYTAYGVPTIANTSGTVLNASAYSNRYLYTGREWDNDIQQFHYRARMYDAPLGRFCSKDPIGFEGSPWNLFGYCKTSPLLFLDPSGTEVFYPTPVTVLPTENELEPIRGIDRDGCSCNPVNGDRQRPTSPKTGKAPPKPGISIADCDLGEKVYVRYTSSCSAGKKALWCKKPCEFSVCFEYVCYLCEPRKKTF